MGVWIGLEFMFCIALIPLHVGSYVYYIHLLVFEWLCIPDTVTRIFIVVVPDL